MSLQCDSNMFYTRGHFCKTIIILMSVIKLDAVAHGDERPFLMQLHHYAINTMHWFPRQKILSCQTTIFAIFHNIPRPPPKKNTTKKQASKQFFFSNSEGYNLSIHIRPRQLIVPNSLSNI